MPISVMPVALICRLAACATLIVGALSAQPVALSKDPRGDLLERALHSERDARSKVPLSIIISFLPSAHPESKLVIRFISRTQAEVESIQPNIASGTALQRAGRRPADIAAALALMRVTRKRLPVDPAIVSTWLSDFRNAVSASLAPMERASFDGPLQLDGTLYEMLYRGEAEMSITLAGCEVGSDCTHEVPLVQWMDGVRKKVEAMAGHAGN